MSSPRAESEELGTAWNHEPTYRFLRRFTFSRAGSSSLEKTAGSLDVERNEAVSLRWGRLRELTAPGCFPRYTSGKGGIRGRVGS